MEPRNLAVSELAERLLALVDELDRPRVRESRIAVRDAGRIVLLDVSEIDWVEAGGNYARLHVGTQSYSMRVTMNNLLLWLGEDRFFRIHRACIVNVARIQELRVAGNGKFQVVLTSGVRLRLSRQRKRALEARLGGGDATESRP